MLYQSYARRFLDGKKSYQALECSGRHAEAVSEHIKMKRRNTIQRDAMHASIKDEHLEHHVHA